MSSSVDSNTRPTSRNGLVPKLNFQVSIPSTEGGDKSTADTLLGALRPLTVSLKMTGLCFETQYQRLVSVSLIYCYVVLVLNWIHSLGLFFAYNSNLLSKWEILMKIVFHTLFLHCAVTVTIFLIKINRQFPRVIRKWEVYRAKYKGVSLQTIGKYTLKFIAVLWVGYVLMAASGLMLMSTRYAEVVRIVLKPFVDQSTPMSIIIPCRIFHYFIFLPYAFSIAFVFLVCKLLKMEFVESLVQSNIPRRSHVESRDPSRDFDKFRRRHLAMTEVLNLFHDTVSGYVLTSLTIDLTVIGFYILLIIMGDEVYVDGGFAPFVAHWLTISVPGFHMFVIALAGFMLQRQAQTVRDHLYNVVDVENLSASKQLTFQLFDGRLLNDHFGITAGGLLNVGKNVLVFVLLVILVYTMMIARFALPNNTPDVSQISENGVTMASIWQNQTSNDVP